MVPLRVLLIEDDENDAALVGELYTNPNARTFAQGRLFTERGYTIKLSGVYRFPYDVRFGWAARYQDGQHFARMIVVPNLNQGPEIVRAFRNGRTRFTFTATLDARLRAARIYDRHLQERGRAVELYRQVTTHETDARRIQEANKRLADLAGTRMGVNYYSSTLSVQVKGDLAGPYGVPWKSITGVTCLSRDTLERATFDAAACGFAYRTSRFKRQDRDRHVVFGVSFRLRRNAVPALRYPELAGAVRENADLARLPPAEAVRLVRDTVLALRRRKSMVLDAGDPNTRSVGSFFLNPVLSREAFAELERRWKAAGATAAIPTFPAGGGVKVPAGWLVEQAGFRKGYRKDGVGISSRHALALVNLGGTTAQLLALAQEIERAVEQRFGVRLEREPVVVAG